MQRSGEQGRTVRGAGSFHSPVTRSVGLLVAFHIGSANLVGATQYRRRQRLLVPKKASRLKLFCAAETAVTGVVFRNPGTRPAVSQITLSRDEICPSVSLKGLD